MRTVCWVTVLAVLAIADCQTVGQEKPQKDDPPNLSTTLEYMQNTLAHYGYIHTAGKDQEINLKKSEDEPCRVYVDWSIKYSMHTPQDGEYPNTYQFHLGTIDPDSVKVIMDANQKQPEGWKIIRVHLATTNNRSTIFESASDFEESKKVPKSLQLNASSDFNFQFRDKEQAEK